ncbi:MAG: ABC transporter substrate-binding protein [Betaproteobacteria bacterium]
MPTVGVLAFLAGPNDPLYAAMRQRLRELGYVEGRDIRIEFRTAAGHPERMQDLADELVRLKVDVIFTLTAVATAAARHATSEIPIVMALGGDPVAAGLATSLAHPGGNITGLSFMHPELSGKILQLLKEAVPRLSRVAILWSPGIPLTAPQEKFRDDIKAAASSLTVELVFVSVRTPEELETAFATVNNARIQAIYLSDSPLLYVHRDTLIRLATRSRLPTIYRSRIFVESGGLMSYGVDWLDQARRAAGYIDKILKGAKPGDLPIEQPTKIELLVNLKTAKQLGIAIPESILLRADEVIR